MNTTAQELPKAYEPTQAEEKWYPQWIDADDYHADPTSEKPAFSIVIPPPNVTGVLTLGHVLNNTIQDILARRARLLGHEVLWLPGTDHAGIATQTVVERKLRKEEKKTRHDLGREAFLERVWAWKKEHGDIIIRQLKKLGCSCDWKRERFTMDDAYARRVQEVFVDLYNKGLIYRGKRMVNWCPVSLTALSDEEVIPKSQKSFLYHFKVEVVEEPGTFLEIATTRPETIMGDSGVAVNPKDPRYKKFIGKHIRRPLPLDRPAEIPIVGDEAVEFEFGTGVLKVTPAHDKTDYEIGQRHDLEIIDILNPDATLNALAGADYEGLDRFEARKKAVEQLCELELLVKEEAHENNIGFSERADVPIEPRLSEQWFLRYPKVTETRDAVRNSLIEFFPKRWEKVFDHWMENIQDWCISRQLWWGHRIPVWYPADAVGDTAKAIASTDSPGENYVQDPDVLDTWFSSWLWVHDTMDVETRKKFYPTSVLVTGPDILFFWVARMIMAGLEYEEKIPFEKVFFTGIIRDKSGRKMSKSLGNSPNPLDLIAKFGADGLRYGLLRIAPQGQDIRFDEQQVVDGRNFCNKLWNACRFRQLQGPVDPEADPGKHDLSIFDHDILARLDATIQAIDQGYEDFKFNEIAQSLHEFIWSAFCDRYIEVAKIDFRSDDSKRKAATLAVIDYVLRKILILLHPYTPFLTEELWHGLGLGTQTIQFENWPQSGNEVSENSEAAVQVEEFFSAVSAARNLRAIYNLPPNQPLPWLFQPKKEWAKEHLAKLENFLRASSFALHDGPPPKGCAVAVCDMGDILLPLEGLIDVEAERARLQKESEKVESEIQKVSKKLANESFVKNAPEEIITEHRDRQKQWQQRLSDLMQALENLK
ncbi:MAG: valine--tRNA ligase [Chthoniobacterales bacterium]